MSGTAGNNIIRVLGTTSASNFLAAPFYNQNGDWYEVVCHNNAALSVYHVPQLLRLPLGLILGNGSGAGTSGRMYAGAGAPNIAASNYGDYYFRTDTATTPSQQIYIATGTNTWASISGGSSGSSTLAGDTDVALTSPADGQVLTYVASTSKWVNAAPSGNTSVSINTEETAIPLGAGASFTGQSHAVITPVLATVAAESDQAYTVNIQQSNNNSTWTTTYTATPTLNSGIYAFSYSIPLRRYDYMRVVVVNGSTGQAYLTVSSALVG